MVDDWKSLAALIALLVPVHQGLIEALKTATGIKLRRYFEAIAEIVYGPRYESLFAIPGQTESPPDAKSLTIGQWFGTKARLVPKELGQERRLEWVEGAQRRLVESFVQRGVGDSPNPDLSEQDIDNVVSIIREEAPEHVREAARRLRYLAQHGAGSATDAARALRAIRAEGEAAEVIATWAAEIATMETITGVDVALRACRDMFVERFLPREHAARIELPNTLKSAELRYHFDLWRLSILVALAEGFAVAAFSTWDRPNEVLLTAVVTATSLFVLSQGSKGLIDSLIGLGSRLRF